MPCGNVMSIITEITDLKPLPSVLKDHGLNDLLHSTENSALCYVAAWMRGEFGGEWIHVYVWLSPFAVYLKLSHMVN